MLQKKNTDIEQQVNTFLHNAKSRAKRDNVPFELTKEYLLSIVTNECPVFKTPLEWGQSGLGKGHAKPNGPTLDRILPELGYVPNNVAFISYRANRIKDNGTMKEHYAIADWIWNHTHVEKKSITPVSDDDNWEGEIHKQYGTILGTWIGENNDSVNNSGGSF
jgi:hypothetical protein